jgi:hypothetical protein
VLAEAEALVDFEASNANEVADPYVAAMACQIADAYPGARVVVATNDWGSPG